MCFIKQLLGPTEVIYEGGDDIKTELSLCAVGLESELYLCTACMYTYPDEKAKGRRWLRASGDCGLSLSISSHLVEPNNNPH